MLNNLNGRRAGFTLVEIMIVVAIIALLAAIAVPNFLRARKRSQATSILNTLRIIDDAKTLYAADNKSVDDSATIDWQDQAGYVKQGTPLYGMYAAGAVVDLLGNPVDDRPINDATYVPDATRAALDDVLGGVGSPAADAFWAPHIRTVGNGM